jgi:hypothetical protein
LVEAEVAKENVYCRMCSALIPGPEADKGDVCRACREKDAKNTGRPVADRVALNLKTRLESELTAAEERLAHAEAAAQHLEAALQAYDGTTGGRGKAGALPDLARRIHVALDAVLKGIAEAEKRTYGAETDLEKARAELAAFRTREQQLRETRLHMLQAKHLSGDLDKRLEHVHALLHEIGGAAAAKSKGDGGLPDVEKHIDEAEQAAARGIRETELKLSHFEDQLAESRTALAAHRARESHLRAMDLQLWQARQLAEDLDRNLTALAGTFKTLRERTQSLLAEGTTAHREEKSAETVAETRKKLEVRS